ncbi:MAG TPA: NAD(+) diphosphatase [Solirubrobacteraceae bacterium]
MNRLVSIPDYTSEMPTFTGMTLDRAMDERSDPGLVARLAEDPAARTIAASEQGVLISNGGSPELFRAQLAREAAQLASETGDQPMLLGLDDGAGVFAVDLDSLPPRDRTSSTDGGKVVSLREAGSVLSRPEAALAAYLAALLNWHRFHRFCANCAAVTVVKEAGYSRRCPRCHTSHFPRTDPVVIMTVEHADSLLLGRRAGWPGDRYSVLAGFVSPGEAAEEAVIREVREESGIVARDPEFVSSQPWPFPRSLMLGFSAKSDGGEPRAHDGELEKVRWFSRDEINAAIDGTNPEFRLPPGISIARFLIDRWLARGPLTT